MIWSPSNLGIVILLLGTKFYPNCILFNNVHPPEPAIINIIKAKMNKNTYSKEFVFSTYLIGVAALSQNDIETLIFF